MKKLKLVLALMFLSLIGMSCEKENEQGLAPEANYSHSTDLASSLKKGTISIDETIDNGRAQGQKWYFMIDTEGEACCPEGGSGCGAVTVVDGIAMEQFFDNNGGYNNGSFEANYNTATQQFPSGLIDGVIQGIFTTRLHANTIQNNDRYVVFRDMQGNNVQSYYLHYN